MIMINSVIKHDGSVEVTWVDTELPTHDRGPAIPTKNAQDPPSAEIVENPDIYAVVKRQFYSVAQLDMLVTDLGDKAGEYASMIDALRVAQVEEPNAEELAEHMRAEAFSYLNSTDWYYARAMETGEAVPTDVIQKRIQARASLNT